MAELEVLRNRGVRDPCDILEAQQAREAKKKEGCLGCVRGAKLLGGTGSCEHRIRAHGCGYIHDENK